MNNKDHLVGQLTSFPGTLVPWCPDALVSWGHDALVLGLSWCSGFQFVLVLWFSGGPVLWWPGASCQSCPPAHSAVTRVSSCRSANYTEEAATARLTAE